jgi:predicted GNAT superfamily acetyltransferase
VQGDVAIRMLATPAEYAALVALIGGVWIDPDGHPAVATDLLAALAHFGGYVAGAFADDGALVAGGYGFVGRHGIEPVLHSHTVCVAPGLEHRGLGYALKHHQRSWAAAQSLAGVTWTFDPLVRRNAYFNLTKLGACIVGYEVDLYGPLRDGTNAGDETDRAIAWWPVADSPTPPTSDTPERCARVFVPDDIVELRRRDPAAARVHRTRVRDELGARVRDGWRATAMSRDGWYTVVAP